MALCTPAIWSGCWFFSASQLSDCDASLRPHIFSVVMLLCGVASFRSRHSCDLESNGNGDLCRNIARLRGEQSRVASLVVDVAAWSRSSLRGLVDSNHVVDRSCRRIASSSPWALNRLTDSCSCTVSSVCYRLILRALRFHRIGAGLRVDGPFMRSSWSPCSLRYCHGLLVHRHGSRFGLRGCSGQSSSCAGVFFLIGMEPIDCA